MGDERVGVGGMRVEELKVSGVGEGRGEKIGKTKKECKENEKHTHTGKSGREVEGREGKVGGQGRRALREGTGVSLRRSPSLSLSSSPFYLSIHLPFSSLLSSCFPY